MRIWWVPIGILVATVAFAEEPEVEARLEEAASAAAAVERVLGGRRGADGSRCEENGCRPAETKPMPALQQPVAPRQNPGDDAVARDVATPSADRVVKEADLSAQIEEPDDRGPAADATTP